MGSECRSRLISAQPRLNHGFTTGSSRDSSAHLGSTLLRVDPALYGAAPRLRRHVRCGPGGSRGEQRASRKVREVELVLKLTLTTAQPRVYPGSAPAQPERLTSGL